MATGAIQQAILKELEARGITRYRLAKMLRVRPRKVYNWLRPGAEIRVGSAELMMEALNLEVSPCSLRKRLGL